MPIGRVFQKCDVRNCTAGTDVRAAGDTGGRGECAVALVGADDDDHHGIRAQADESLLISICRIFK